MEIVTNALACTLTFLLLAIGCAANTSTSTGVAIRLTGFNSTVFGHLEIHSNDTWLAACSDVWTLKNSFAACKTLGYNYAVMVDNDRLR